MYLDKSMRLESVRVIIDERLLTLKDSDLRRMATVHLYGVAQSATMLATKRGLDPELGAIIGMFHDLYVYLTGVKDFHDQSGAEIVGPIIRDMGLFTKEEQGTILKAIFRHSDKATIHSAYDELIKDADVLARYCYNSHQKVKVKNGQRLAKVIEELGMDAKFELREEPLKSPIDKAISRRVLLADLARGLAVKRIVGTPEDEAFKVLCSYWPDTKIYQEAKNSWCALFVYHCCRMVGIKLPIKHPKVDLRYAAVGAWQDWAILIGDTYHKVDEADFLPEKGDIVIYEQLLSEDHHDHIGIVLDCDGNLITVAEGNVNNDNYSGIVTRSRVDHVAGYVRISDDYTYNYHGSYEPRLEDPPTIKSH